MRFAKRSGLVVADAEIDQDLDALARAALGHLGILLAGLGRPRLRLPHRAWGYAAPAPPCPGREAGSSSRAAGTPRREPR